VQVGDIILKVGQGKDEPQDLAGFDTDDAVKLIRGKKGTEVRLTLKRQMVRLNWFRSSGMKSCLKRPLLKAPSSTTEIKRSAISICRSSMQTGRGLTAPAALWTWQRNHEAEEQNVNGIIMDLRGNGGGSLVDVIQMVGLFIEEGPLCK
jgi:carboxyl-terminal processing protease